MPRNKPRTWKKITYDPNETRLHIIAESVESETKLFSRLKSLDPSFKTLFDWSSPSYFDPLEKYVDNYGLTDQDAVIIFLETLSFEEFLNNGKNADLALQLGRLSGRPERFGRINPSESIIIFDPQCHTSKCREKHNDGEYTYIHHIGQVTHTVKEVYDKLKELCWSESDEDDYDYE